MTTSRTASLAAPVRLRAACLLAAACLLPAAAVRAQDLRVLYAEPIPTTFTPVAAPGLPPGGLQELRFTALGREFDLLLEPANGVVTSGPAGRSSDDLLLLHGSVAGAPRSWIRLSRSNGGLAGLLSDGQSLYGIEPASRLARFMSPAANPPTGSMIYRLSDVVWLGPPMSCGSRDSSPVQSAEILYQSLAAELSALEPAQKTVASRRLDVDAIADAVFTRRFGNTAEQAVLERLNIVDGIFQAELGIELRVSRLELLTARDDPYSGSLAGPLLETLAAERASDRSPGSGLSYLFTGRDLMGDQGGPDARYLAGIAYVGTVCDARYAAGLSEASDLTFIDALLAAHEMGHVFGAIHDGSGHCASEPADRYIMAPYVGAAISSYSACSKNDIGTQLTAARCLTPTGASYGDAEILGPGRSYAVGYGERFAMGEWIKNSGTAALEDVRIRMILPSFLRFDADAGAPECLAGQGYVECVLGHLEPAAVAAFRPVLQARATGQAQLEFDVLADNEGDPTDNRGVVNVTVQAATDLLTVLELSSRSASLSETLSLTAITRNAGDLGTERSLLLVGIPGALEVISHSADRGSCEVDVTGLSCSFDGLDSGAEARVTAVLRPLRVGSFELAAESVAQVPQDNDVTNNVARAAVDITGDTSSGSTPANGGSGAGGGGGTFDVYLLATLAFIALLRARLRTRRHPSPVRHMSGWSEGGRRA